MRIIKRSFQVLKEEGLSAFTRKAALRIAGLIYSHQDYVLYALEGKNEEWFRRSVVPAHQLRDNLHARLAAREDLWRFSKMLAPRDLKVMRRWFDLGCYCFVALDGEFVVSYGWITFRDHRSPFVGTIKVADDEFYGFDAKTAPGYGENSLFFPLLAQMFAFTREKGRTRLITFTLAEWFNLWRRNYRRGKFVATTDSVKPLKFITTRWIFGVRLTTAKDFGRKCRLPRRARSYLSPKDLLTYHSS